MSTGPRLPLYIKGTILLFGLVLFVGVLYLAKNIILPFCYAALLAILLSPAVHFLEKRRVNRALAIGGVLAVAIILIGMVILLLFSQFSLLSDALPQLSLKFDELIANAVRWTSGYFNISVRKINAWMAETKADMISNSGMAIGTTLTTIGGVMATLFLTPVYVFMLLYYQPHLIAFAHKVFGSRNGLQVDEIFSETKAIIQSYLGGLFAEFAIIAVLNSAGLLLLGIDYAILLGIIGALLNVIPYVGGLIGVMLFIVIAMVTKSPVYILYVIGLYSFIQMVDNNYIVPRVVGSKVKLNALISLLAVIAGAALWGIPGMFLSIPMMAIIKLLCDRIDSLKPWGFLLGETTLPTRKAKS